MLIPGKLYKSTSKIDFYNDVILTKEQYKYKNLGEPTFNTNINSIMFVEASKILYVRYNFTVLEMVFLYKNKFIAIRPEKKDELVLL